KEIPNIPCALCTHGGIDKSETVTVTIPAGVATGQVLRLHGKGDEHPAAPPGSLYIALTVETQNVLRREGEHAVIQVPVPLVTALFGGTLRVQTLDGTANVRVHRRCYDGEIVTLPEQGYARAGGSDPYRSTSRGDQRVVLRVSHEVQKRRDTIRWIAIIVA